MDAVVDVDTDLGVDMDTSGGKQRIKRKHK